MDSSKASRRRFPQPAVQKGKDADKRILADKAFLNALVVKDPKRLIEHLLVKGALLQRIGMSLVDGLFAESQSFSVVDRR